MMTLVDLHIPPSTSTVNVSIINTGTTFDKLDLRRVVEPEILGHKYLDGPCFIFLIRHPEQNRTVLFDLGITKNWENLPKPTYDSVVGRGATPVVPEDVRSFLDNNGVDAKNIEAVIWSHSHFDHIGDVSRFDPSTKIVVGGGTKEDVFPGYPTNQAAAFHESDVAGHEVEELDFRRSSLEISGFAAIDYFGDGSFYLLETPGHCIGHMCGFARVTSNPDSFILMGADAIHHGGQLRPNPWHPLPESIFPNPFDTTSDQPCPGEIFEKLLPNGREAPFYLPSQRPLTFHLDVPTMNETIRKLQEADAHDNVLIIPAHDGSFVNMVDHFPETANAFLEKGLEKKTRWAWLVDFAEAVGQPVKMPSVL